MATDLLHQINPNKYKTFGGNPFLKACEVKLEWTKETLTEWIKCKESCQYFIEHYMKVIDPDGNLVTFKLWPVQVEMLQSIIDNRFSAFETARRVGKSTVTCGFILWYILFNSEKTVGLLANKEDTAIEILGKIELAYQYLPFWLQQGIAEFNKKSIVLENNSRVLAAATSSSAIRGYGLQLLFLDEVAHIEKWDEFFTSVFSTISSGKETKAVLVSTPKGLNHFWKITTEGKQHRNDFNVVTITWDKIPGRDQAWKDKMISIMGEEAFSQEHEVQYLGSSGTLIAGWKLKQLTFDRPIFNFNPGMELSMYQQPIKDHRYALIADVSAGKKLDYSAFHVIDITQMPFQQVCTFHNNTIPPIEYAQVIHQAAKLYNNAWVLVENKVMGGEVCNSLWYDFEYEYLIYTESGGRNGKRATLTPKRSSEIGLNTSVASKAVGCSMLKLLVEQNKLIIRDADTISELSTFSKKGKSYEAEEGKFDDLVMGLVLFGWFSAQDIFKELSDTNTIQKLREKSEEELLDDLLPFGMNTSGAEEMMPVVDIGSMDLDAWLRDDNNF